MAACEYLRNNNVVDDERIVLWGESYGAFVALSTAWRFPDVCKSIVAFAPIVDWIAQYESAAPSHRQFQEYFFNGSPSERGQLYRRVSPMSYADQCKAPVVVVQGRDDARCPFAATQAFVNTVRASSGRAALIEHAYGHNDAPITVRSAILELCMRFAELSVGGIGDRDVDEIVRRGHVRIDEMA